MSEEKFYRRDQIMVGTNKETELQYMAEISKMGTRLKIPKEKIIRIIKKGINPAVRNYLLGSIHENLRELEHAIQNLVDVINSQQENQSKLTPGNPIINGPRACLNCGSTARFHDWKECNKKLLMTR